jgi:sugar lactone lactonase YvrE
MDVFDGRRCELGEGALWHPIRGQLFWFDISGRALLSREGDEAKRWDFESCVSAAGWIDRDHLLVASETGLWRLALSTGHREHVSPLDCSGGRLRPNDGRADPWGGFWISTMGRNAEDRAGSIWRLWRGEMRLLFPGLTIPNAICFDREREVAYLADTAQGIVWRQALDPASGWPRGEPEVFLELARSGLNPDGAIVDAAGRFWNAQWGASRVACYDANGAFLGEEKFEARQLSCPAFGGLNLDILHVTSAQHGMDEKTRRGEPFAGMTFARRIQSRGVPEPAVIP